MKRRRWDPGVIPRPRGPSSPRAALTLSLGAFLGLVAAAANATSSDATLRALSLEDRDGATVAFSPGLDPAKTSYTANAPARVDRITVEATKNDDGATVAHLDGDDQPLTDADAVEDHFQVDLEAGANTIKVKVTAEDTVTAATYTLVVTRAVPMASSGAWLSNQDESNDAGIAVGTPADSPTIKSTQAIRFQTGSNERGYNLTSVKAVLANATASDGVRVRIFGARSIGTPYLSFYTLTNPVIADGTLTFTAPASATLRKNAGYFVVFDSTAPDAGNDYEIRGTESESLNTVADGWSLNADRHSRNRDSASWTTASAVPLIEINGEALVQATDANLKALRMRDGNGKLVTYSPFFDSAITSYGTTASPKVDRITIQATASNADGAEVDYLDGDDQLLTDADAEKDGFQVDLEFGPNTIKVRVTAEDGSTTRTYTMVVTREPSRVSADALASNLDEHFSKRLYIGNLEPGKILRNQALGFETGGNEAGYVLASVKILIWEITHSAGVRVRVFSSTAEGNPDSSLYTLSGSIVLPTNPDLGPEESARVSTLDAPANATLEPNTKYFVVLDSRASELYRFYKVFGTKSDAISKVADGWSMNDFRHTGIRDTGVWTTADDVPFVEVAGHAVVPSSDATLSALDLTWDDAGTAADITLNPVFNASTTSYTAGVASGVDRITIKETKGDSGATVNYFDGADSALTDADANATGFQVGLAVGANTIKAKVMASDGETTQTYTVVVTRAAGDTTAPTANGATVNGATLAIAFDESLAAAANLANGVFTVKKTPSGGSEETVALSGSPAISGATVTLTLAVAVVSTDTVTVSYTRPTSGTANALEDAAGNEVASFADRTVTNNTVVALRAWFQNVPDAHDGSSVFTLELAFSEAVFDGTESFDKNEVIKNALEVTNGTIRGRRRADPGAYDLWILRIGPSGDDDVTVRLPATTGDCNVTGAICTPDGRPLSTAASATIEGPTAEAPDAPSAPTLTAGETWLEASWTAPADNGAAITDYDVHYRETGGNWQDASHAGTTATKRIESLTADTAYQVRVRASNAEGAGDWSPAASARTDPSAEEPDAPSAPTLTVGETWVEASWTAPADNGAAITGYDVHYRTTNGNWTDAGHAGTATTKRVGSLVADTAYEVRVRASNAEGAGDWSPAASARTDPSAEEPDAPSAPTLTVGETWLEASWTAPADNGAAITGYDVHYRTTNGNWTDAGHAGTATTKRIESLAADTAYEVRVRASNAEGAGDWSPAASARTDAAAEAPDAPSAPTLTAGETWVEASWTAPADNGSAITGYDVHYRTTNGNWTDAGHAGTATTKRIESLAADAAYEVRVRASNAEGTGDWSPVVSGRTDAADGAAEGDVRLVNGSTSQEGRVEIYHDGEWGTVCDDRFVSDDAEVVCRQLGYTGGQAHTRAAFGAGTGTIWMDDVQCTGSESRLADCPFGGWGLHNCRHSEDVGVSCGAASSLSLNHAAVSGSLLTLRFARPLDGGSVPTPGDFVVAAGSGAGAAVVPVESVDVIDGAAVVSLTRTVEAPENVSVSYLPAAMHPLRDTSLNPVPAFTARPIAHTPTTESTARAATPGIRRWNPSKVEFLDLSSRGLAALDELSALTDLEQLDLGGNRVSDLSPLLATGGLERLNLSGNAISDISGIGALSNLRVLDLSDNAVSDISPLAGLTRLRRLDLSGNRVADLRPLSELRGLEVLLLDGNLVSDLVPLWGLTELAHLGLGNNRVADAVLLREARSLRRLDLAGNRLRDVSVLGDLPKLAWLRLSGNPIADFSPLGRLTTVRWLVLDAGTSRAEALPWGDGERLPPLLIETTDGPASGGP